MNGQIPHAQESLKLFKRLFFFLFVLIQFNPLFAQDIPINITGTVTLPDNEPMFGVSVLEMGTNNGTTTDMDGQYVLTVSPKAVLKFSFIGFESQEIPVQGRTLIDVVLEDQAELLDEVVITGYKKEIKSDVATAISSIKSKDIDKLVVMGIDQALQGQAPGIMVTQTTGAPGDDIAVRIRGVGTIGNNNPLYIIDGVPTTGNINMFSTNDIESIQVLKDGASASIYGARAANGVVIITTKKGKAGKVLFTLDASSGTQQANRLPELLNAEEFLTIRNEAIANANELRIPIRQLPLYDPAILDTLPDTDWMDLLFNNAPIQRYSLSATGGSEASKFFILGEYQDQDGVFRGQAFKKYLLRFNGEVGNKWLKIGNNMSFSVTDRKIINSSGDGFGAGNELSGIRYTMITSPLVPVYNPDGSYLKVTSELGDPMLYGDGNPNPIAFVDATDWTINRYRIFGNVYAEVKLMEGLNLRTTLGADMLFEIGKLFKERLSQAVYDPTSLSESRVFDRNIIWNNTLDFTRTLGRFNVSALIGTEAIQNKTNYLDAAANNFSSTNPLFRYINSSVTAELGDVSAGGVETEWALLSYFGQAGVSFDRRYVINASLRRDGSSRFGKGNRWGLFPSLSAAWNVSNEAFFADVPVISTLKLRSSWGKLGNQEIGIYPFSSLVETGLYVYDFGNQIVTGARLVEAGNSNIKWETTSQTDFGLELGILEDKLSLVADYYIKTTEDILVRVPIPQAGGSQNPPYVNAGVVENKGLELGLIYRGGSGQFNYSIGANIATVHNEVLSLADSEPIPGGFGLSDGAITKTEVGYPIGSFFLWEMEGIFQSQEEIDASPFQTVDTRPGDIKFADLNGDDIIDDEDRAHLGNPFPDYIYGLNLNLSYKNFDLSVMGQGIKGNDVYFLYGNFAYEVPSRGFNSYKEILDRWTPEHTNTDIPKVSIDDRNGNRRISTRWLEDGSYFRIRNISLGYNFKDLFKTDAIGSFRVYLTVQNAFTFTKYPGLDPEIQANTNDTQGINISSDLAVGIDWGTVPAPRTIIAGIRMDF
ncbi:MAG: TonB-dependent receptor [Saprospiraceae bacterium]|nr:TonB-dependent receptor [Saprospiraceae bacterium]MCB9322557.1 TonB-dependent receptor [Lewinellaceae bacterium]